MEKLSKRNLLVVGLMLFSLFFGAGNLIIPPFMGQEAGTNVGMAFIGFLITAVGFPVLGVISVAKTNGVKNLATRVNSKFAYVYTILVYLSIGPLLGIPRAGSLPYEMTVAPFMGNVNISHRVALLLFTVAFFAFAYWLASTPTKLVDRMGKVLTPMLLFLIFFVFVGKFIKPFGDLAIPAPNYEKSPFIKGFLEGYLTLDTISALNFGLIISIVIRGKGVDNKEDVVKNIIKSGLIAGVFLVLIYGVLAYLGALSGGLYGTTDNGAETLTNVVQHIFGLPGLFLLAAIFTLACLTTCVGLLSSCSQYFTTVIPNMDYEKSLKIFTLWSLVAANLGLSKLMSISVPILNAIYPISLMLIVLSIFGKLDNKNNVYLYTILFTGVFSVAESLYSTLLGLGVNIKIIEKIIMTIPFGEAGLGWLLPALAGFVIGYILDSKTSLEK